MDEGLNIPANHHGMVWVFRVNLPEAEANIFYTETHRDNGTTDWPILDALGVAHLDHDYVEMFDASTLKEYSLSRYLAEANSIVDPAIAEDAAKLDALEGMILLIFSSAIPEGTAAFSPKAPLTFVGRYGGLEHIPDFVEMVDDDAVGVLTSPPTTSTEKLGGSWLASIVVALIAVLILLMVFVV